MSPGFEGFENSEKLLIMHVIVQLRRGECARIEGNHTGDHIVRSISFNGNWGARLIVGMDESCCEGLLQLIKGTSTVLREVPGGIFPSKPS